MFGLGLKRADRQLNAGWLIFAALLPDFLLDFLFTFPWSHGLAAEFVWATIASSNVGRTIAFRRPPALRSGAPNVKRPVGMIIYIAALSIFLVVGQAGAGEVPPRAGLIASWLAAPPAMAAIAFWLDR